MPMSIDGYYETACQIISVFNKLAPYERYSGGNPIETQFLLRQISEIEEKDPHFANAMIREVIKTESFYERKGPRADDCGGEPQKREE